MSRKNKKLVKRRRIAMGTRSHLRAISDRPRLSVFRSLNNIYCQIIDDSAGATLASASSLDQQLRGAREGRKKVDVAAQVGGLIAERATAAGVVQVKFDRGGYRFHGRIKALADAARAGGLQF